MMSFSTRPLQLATVAACAVLGACSKDIPIEPRVVTKLEVLAGADQLGGVGSALPIKILVRTSDTQGPLGGVAVSATTEVPGGGSAAPTAFTTGTNGQAEIVWTLGPHVGTQTLTLTAPGIPPVPVSATAQIGGAAGILPVSDAFQFTVVTRAVTIRPSVRVIDAFGNPVSGTTVTFDAPVAGSVLAGTQVVSDASGIATLGSWTIGPDAIDYSVRALILSGPAAGQTTTFLAHGVPATLVAIAGIGQTSNAGTAVTVAPAVLASRDDATPLSGVPVSFQVTVGGGAIQGGAALTGLDGIARPTAWVLGAVPGNNQLNAQAGGVPPVTFTATGVPGVAASVLASSPAVQSGFFGNFLAAPPSVVVSDAQGHPVAGVPVTFELLQADGQLVGTNQLSDALGHATLDAWRLGSAASEGVRALVTGSPPVTFTANASAPPASTFHLEVRYRTDQDGCGRVLGCRVPTVAQRAAFDQAAARWKQIILSGSAPYPVNEAASTCFPTINETVDGLVIFVSLVPIDLAGNILGQSGPCIVRDDHGFQPAVGLMELDVADLDVIQAQGQLNDVILHEMAHVLGFGTMWDFDPSEFGPPIIPIGPDNPPNTLLTGRGTANPVFTGLSTRAAFLAAVAPGHTFTGVPVPVANVGGVGTRDSHWREATVTTELMTGFISNPGTPNPLSAFSITSFRDLGYVVNDALGDPFTFLAALQAAPGLPSLAGGFQLNEEPISFPIIVIDRHGRRVATVPRK